MKKALAAIVVVVLALAAAVAGYLYGRSGGNALANIPGLGSLAASQPRTLEFQPGQLNPSQMTEEQRQQFRQGRMGGVQGGLPGNAAGFAGGIFGAIESIEDGVLTIKSNDGSLIKVETTDTTLIQKLMDVGVADLRVGESVTVSGSQSEDGTTTARSIRVLTAPDQ